MRRVCEYLRCSGGMKVERREIADKFDLVDCACVMSNPVPGGLTAHGGAAQV